MLAEFPLGRRTGGGGVEDDGEESVLRTTASQQHPQLLLLPVVYNPPRAFPGMPTTEVDWVREQRMQLKQRRRNNNRGASRHRLRLGRNSRSPSSPRVPDSSEVIAAKRAARQAKRDAADANSSS